MEKETKELIQILYQNREQEAYERLEKMFPVFQWGLEEIAARHLEQETRVLLEGIKQLLECYHARDMMGMADCLKGSILPIIEKYL